MRAFEATDMPSIDGPMRPRAIIPSARRHVATMAPGAKRHETIHRKRAAGEYRERMNGSNVSSSTSQRVLIVEDDDDSREMLGELIASYGHQPMPAANATEALERARAQKPDLALIDLGLPQLDGCELARLLRQAMAKRTGSKTRLVALTGYSDRQMRESAGAAGFDAYVVKPLMPEALEELLRA